MCFVQTFQAASGRDGSLLWKFNDSSLNVVMNAYTGQYVGDLDADGVPDILNIHGGDPLGEPGKYPTYSTYMGEIPWGNPVSTRHTQA